MEKRDTNTKELTKFHNAKMLFSATCIPIKKAIEKEVSYAKNGTKAHKTQFKSFLFHLK
jgi:hypothetical protein